MNGRRCCPECYGIVDLIGVPGGGERMTRAACRSTEICAWSGLKAETVSDPFEQPNRCVHGRYQDEPTPIIFTPHINHEIAVTIGDGEPEFVDALDLLRVVSHVALELVYGPSPTEGGQA